MKFNPDAFEEDGKVRDESTAPSCATYGRVRPFVDRVLAATRGESDAPQPLPWSAKSSPRTPDTVAGAARGLLSLAKSSSLSAAEVAPARRLNPRRSTPTSQASFGKRGASNKEGIILEPQALAQALIRREARTAGQSAPETSHGDSPSSPGFAARQPWIAIPPKQPGYGECPTAVFPSGASAGQGRFHGTPRR